MSFDLAVLRTTTPLTNAEALKRYIAYCEEADLAPYIEPSSKIDSFVKELTASYPQIDDLPDDKIDECPWSIAFDMSPGHVIMPMVFSSSGKMSKLIIELAKKHGLVCFDPQSTKIVTAPEGIHAKQEAWWKFW